MLPVQSHLKEGTVENMNVISTRIIINTLSDRQISGSSKPAGGSLRIASSRPRSRSCQGRAAAIAPRVVGSMHDALTSLSQHTCGKYLKTAAAADDAAAKLIAELEGSPIGGMLSRHA